MSENAKQLILEVHKGQSQFAYFQLGLAASAIAFAVHQTTGDSLAETPWPIGLAVFLWAASFALGCFGIGARQRGLLSNAQFLLSTRGIPEEPANADLAAAVNDVKAEVVKDLKRPATLFKWQMWALFAGALAYVGGHVMQMSAVPPKNAVVASSATTKPQ
jgi:hypothetical protein